MDGFSKGGHNQTEFIANMDFSAEYYRLVTGISWDVNGCVFCIDIIFYWSGMDTSSRRGSSSNYPSMKKEKHLIFWKKCSFSFLLYLSPNLPQVQPSYYPSVFHCRILYLLCKCLLKA